MDGGVADTTSCCSTHGGPAVAHYGCTGSAPVHISALHTGRTMEFPPFSVQRQVISVFSVQQVKT